MLTPGSTIVATRLTKDRSDKWKTYTLGATIGQPSGNAHVYRLREATDPPLLAKIYFATGAMRDAIVTAPDHAVRLYTLAYYAAHSGLEAELPFATWPRRLIFPHVTEKSSLQVARLLGFTMREHRGHVSLWHTLANPTLRGQISTAQRLRLASAIADQIHRLHAHPMKFAVGDLSPNNILVGPDLSTPVLIDLDAITFRNPDSGKTFHSPSAWTPGYSSPDFHRPGYVHATPAHDDFVLAILIFQILMADVLASKPPHPFDTLDPVAPDHNIKALHFPYISSLRDTQLPVRPGEAYAAWPAFLRTAFETVFTGRRTITAEEWGALLTQYRRSLRGP